MTKTLRISVPFALSVTAAGFGLLAGCINQSPYEVTFSPESQWQNRDHIFAAPQPVSIDTLGTDEVSNGEICYTLDGSIPDIASCDNRYTGPITLTQSTTINAVFVNRDTGQTSPTRSVLYHVADHYEADDGVAFQANKIFAGQEQSFAITASGTVYGWGDNRNGELGDGTKQIYTVPEALNLNNVVAMESGSNFSCALHSDQTVSCWGANQFGQLGNTSLNENLNATTVAGLPAIAAISAAWYHTCALSTGGEVYCWGNNRAQQLGVDKSTTGQYSTTPIQVSGLTNIIAIDAGGDTSCALSANSELYCWGDNSWGQLGYTGDDSASPVLIQGLQNVQQVAVGNHHLCALVSGQVASNTTSVKCWGTGASGQTGQTGNITTPSPIDVMTEQETIMTGVSAIAAGSRYNCALMNNGGVRCWGANHFGQHGNGLRRNQATADWVLDESMTPISNAVALSAGYRHNLILTEQGEVWSWGDKSYAAPGDGSGGYPETDEVDYEAVGTRLVAGPVLFIQ